MTFPKYPEYKDSGVEWLGEVPAHWKVSRLKFFGELITGITPPSEDLSNYTEAGWPWIRPDDLDDQAKSVKASKFLTDQGWSYCRPVSPGSTLVCCIGSIGKLGYIEELACTNQQITAVQPSYDARYLFYLVYASKPELDLRATGNVLRILNAERLGDVPIVMPPAYESAHIAIFLDYETARIDALVEEQQRLIELLKEKRQAVISHAVTKGLDPDVPMKDSGVEWLGEVPEHWEVKRVKHVVRTFEQGWSPQCENVPVQTADEWGVLKVGCVNNGVFRSSENKKLPQELQPNPALAVRAGDILISRANTRELVGSCAVPTVDVPNLMISDKLFRLRLKKNSAHPRFIAFFMGTAEARNLIELEATGASSSMLNIGQRTILEMEFPCPPLDEQTKIQEQVINQTWQLLDLAGQAIELKNRLEERRSALISAAVTGKIDVRGWQPPLELSESRETADEV